MRDDLKREQTSSPPVSRAASMSRREWLRGAASSTVAVMAAGWATGLGAALATRSAEGIGPLSEFRLVRLSLPGLGHSRTSGLYTLAQQLRMQTSTSVALDVVEMEIEDPRLDTHPFAIVVGDRKPQRWTDSQAARLKSWLESGATLFVDTAGGTGSGSDFDEAFRAEMERIFPRSPLFRVPAEHVLYRSFYRLDYPAGRIIDKPYVEAVSLEGRLAVIYSQNDVVAAWCRDPTGQWEFPVSPGGDGQRQIALRFGLNVVEYALCQDYKDDQVHVDYLLRKRNWKINVPPPTP